MKLTERLNKINELETVETPHKVTCAFGKMKIFGSQVAFGDHGDFLTEEDLRDAIAYLVEELGGKVKWKSAKK